MVFENKELVLRESLGRGSNI